MVDFKKDDFSCCVLGLGYIGLPTAALLAKTKKKVIGVDINPNIVETINCGNIHIVENGLGALVKEVVSNGYLTANSEPVKADVYVIAVPTPLDEVQKGIPSPNIEFVITAAISISKFIEPGNLVILESTSPVGTTEKIAELISKKSGISNDLISIAYCPERVLPGRALIEITSNNRVVGGINKNSEIKVKNFYESFCNGSITTTDSRTAELVKLVENAYRDTNIAFANEISMISSELEIDCENVIKIANNHPRVNILKPGCGVGGHCIAVDPWFIASQLPNQTKLIQTARNINLRKTIWSIERINNLVNLYAENNKIKPVIGIFGLTFKEDIDDIRESPALIIAEKLIENGHNIIICEPHLKKYKDFKIMSSKDIIDMADILVFLVAHSSFKKLKIKGKKIIDLCGINLM